MKICPKSHKVEGVVSRLVAGEMLVTGDICTNGSIK